MIVIKKAALHLLNTDHQEKVLSTNELPIDSPTSAFLLPHLEKCFGKQSAKRGRFYQNSAFQSLLQDYMIGMIDFIAFSTQIASDWYDLLTQAQDIPSSALFVCDLTVEDGRQIALLRTANHTGFIHQTKASDDGGILTTIQNETALLPSPGQSIDEFAFIDTVSHDILLSAKRYTIDGNALLALPEALLECDPSPSPQEALQAIQKTAEKVAKSFGSDPVKTAALVKTALAEELHAKESLEPMTVGQTIFARQPAMQAAMEKELCEGGWGNAQPISLDKKATLKKLLHHKLKTDTGIELTIPVEYFDNTDYLEFRKAEDGSLSITLKHITNLTNRTP